MLGIFLLLTNWITYATENIKNNINNNIKIENAKNSNSIIYTDVSGKRRLVSNNHVVIFNGNKTIDAETNKIIFDPDVEKIKKSIDDNKKLKEKFLILDKNKIINAKNNNKLWVKTLNIDNWQMRGEISLKDQLKHYYVRVKDGLMCRVEIKNIIYLYDKYGYIYDLDIINYHNCLMSIEEQLRFNDYNTYINIDKRKKYKETKLPEVLYEKYIEMVKHNKEIYDLLKDDNYISKYNVSLNIISFEEYKIIYDSIEKLYKNTYSLID